MDSPNLYDSWRSSDMFFQHRLLNKQSIPPGHRRKSNMITKSGHIEKPKVFLTKIRRNFLLETQAKITKECIEEGIFDIANISYKSDEKTEKVVCFKGQIKLWIGHRMGSWLLNWQWGEEVREFSNLLCNVPTVPGANMLKYNFSACDISNYK